MTLLFKCNRGHNEEQFCEIKLKYLDQWFRKCRLIYLFSRARDALFSAETISAIFVKGIMRYNSVN